MAQGQTYTYVLMNTFARAFLLNGISMIRLSSLTAALLLALSLLAPGQAAAAASDWTGIDESRVRVLSAGDAVGSAENLSLGLQVALEEGWKTYWRSPGDAGFPLELDWSDSANVASVEVLWPVPHRFSLFGLETFGYAEEVVYPLVLRPERPGEAVSLRLNVNYLVCQEICIPRTFDLALDLPAGEAQPAAENFLIEKYRALVPGDGQSAGLAIQEAMLTGSEEAPQLIAKVSSAFPFEQPDLIVEGPIGFAYSKPEVALSEDGQTAELRIAVERGRGVEATLAEAPLTLTLFDGQRGMEQQVSLRFGDASAPLLAASAGSVLGGSGPGGSGVAGGGDRGLVVILLFALAGGLLLNLMPCVLPVLSIKLLSAVSYGGQDRGRVRLSFLASAAGILFSFLVLAAGLIAVSAFGGVVGWGIQFQQPLFLAAMALIVTLFACNLFGFFEILLPARLSAVAGIGDDHSYRGHFLTGAFATLLATPCSAPFLGTAVGFALSRGPVEVLLVFTALGVGLALPYLLVAAVPRLATALPKPGPWMIVLRRILGLALLATALWLASVIATQIGVVPAGLLTAALLGIVIWLGLSRRFDWQAKRVRPIAGALAAVVLVTAVAWRGDAGEGATSLAGAWGPLERSEIAGHVADGRLVLVDVTADWCITCQVNKRLVLDSEETAAVLERLDVVLMRGDWTLPDQAIADYLASHGRYGIPFNAVYGPSAPDGLLLPELLSQSALNEALEQAQPEAMRLSQQ